MTHEDKYSPRRQARVRDKNITTRYCSRSARSAGIAVCTSPSKIDNTTGARAIACCWLPVQESRRCARDLPRSGTSSAVGNMRQLWTAAAYPDANLPFSLSQRFNVCACDHVSSTSRSMGTSWEPDDERERCFLLATSICVCRFRTACTTSGGKLQRGQRKLQWMRVIRLTPHRYPPVLWRR